ncbi:hypothetical protein AVEN_140777-1 [Araneus ventricosus]|uniref:Ig-like domain-containing protein n=1 Tax=Araneus ventricosus TaxID=182803 RepID=A0A4Y2MCY3_ARAVE|nr:hypothetical protein AVEN_140777-1 [Araneus ventricosus]
MKEYTLCRILCSDIEFAGLLRNCQWLEICISERTGEITSYYYQFVPPKETIILDTENNELSGVIGPYDEGSELRLRCESIGGYPPPTVTWWRGSTLLDDTFETLPDGVVRNDLVISTLQRSDLLMVLTCNANNNNATVAVATSVKINLNLKPIEARITSLRRTLSAGRRAELECTSAGSRPAARISWWIGTTQLTNSSESFSPDRNRTTSILNLWPTSDHNNKYLSCRAENPMLPGQPVEDGWTLNVSFEEIQLASLINQLQNTNPRSNTETLQWAAEADVSLARNEIVTDDEIIRTATAQDDDDDDVTPVNPVKISHSEAMAALNTSLQWAEEQNFEAHEIMLLRALRDRAFE